MRWATGQFPGEDADSAHVQIWGSGAPLERLLLARPGRPTSSGPASRPDSASSPCGCGARCSTHERIGAAVKPFDIRDPLPTGTTVLEASAGTGKTYTVGALVTRYVAEGHATLEQLLVVTFGRVASLELRERVRGQLVAAERGLADPAVGPSRR